MVLSMTGYGKAAGTFEGKKVIVEIRSLNSKSLDLNIRSITAYREKELELRGIVAEKLDRGKVEVNISIETAGEQRNVSLNKELAKAYYNEIKSLADMVGDNSTDILTTVMRLPDVFSNEKEQISEEETEFLLALMRVACDQLNNFRKTEGDQLKADLVHNTSRIAELLTQVPAYEKERIDIVRERMRSGLEKLTNLPVDENRFEQELIFYLEKMDVSEEKIRLAHHLNYFLETMEIPLCGKKLGFISQEIGREVNTLGSKSYHVEMQKIVVEMKDHLEKIKEQILNTL